MRQVHYIEKRRDVGLLCRDLAGRPLLALDTEFMRKRTYYPKPCLLQIASRDQVFLLDLIKLSDCAEICQVLADNRIDKIMHGCEQDLEVLNQVCGRTIEPVFDTQLAAAFLAYGYQIGYKNLVTRRLAIEINDDQTRSDWARRPLSEEQKDYAANDVIHLSPLWDSLSAELKQSSKYRWFLEENQHRIKRWCDKNNRRRQPSENKAAAQPFMENARQWRESEARRIDIPRQWVVSDACLAAINRSQANDEGAILQLEDCCRLNAGFARVLARMKGKGARGGGMSRGAKGRRLSEEEMDCLRNINRAIKELAQRHRMDDKLIARGKTLARCVHQRSCSAWHRGWRKEAVSASELRQINSWLAAL